MTQAEPPPPLLSPSPAPALRQVIESLPLALAVVTSEGAIACANERFAAAFPDPAAANDALRAAALSADPAGQSVQLLRHDGREVTARLLPLAAGEGRLAIVDELAAESAAAIEAAKQRIAALERLSVTDTLTGIWNRRHLDQTIEIELARSLRHRQPITLVLADIDHFKQINDRCGHLAGDAVLKQFARQIKDCARATDMLFRWGGEEFVLLATGTGYRGGQSLAEKLRAGLDAAPFPEVGSVQASFGVAEYLSGESVETWFKRLDDALYAAKSAGRNHVHVDRQGNSDRWSAQPDQPVLQLTWLEAYECGNLSIDREHRELFDHGNAVIVAMSRRETDPQVWRRSVDQLVAHIEQHFRDEEALLVERGYGKIDQHRRAHAGLLARARELDGLITTGGASAGTLVEFLANQVITGHLFKADRDFFPLFAQVP